MKNLYLLFLSFVLSVQFSFGQSALQFNGSNPDYVQVGNGMNAALAGTNTITVEAWCYLTAYSFLPTVVGNYQSGMQFLLRVDNTRPAFWIDNGGFRVVNGATVIPLNTWTHLAGVWDGSDLKVYINGVLDGTTNGITGSFSSSSNPVRIGANLTSEPWNGKLDDVRIWSTARTATEISNTMNSCVTGSTSGLLALYAFQEGTGTTVADLTGHGYNGTFVNSPTWTTGLGCTTLPVHFINIQATKKNNGVLIDWAVADELDIVRYEIERSVDGSNFSTAGTVMATRSNSYSWLDASPLNQTSYYRVKSVDISGVKKYTGIVKVVAGYESPSITVSPNPVVNHEVNIQFKNKTVGIYNVRLADAAGRVLLAKDITLAAGSSTQIIPLPLNTGRGLYHLIITNPDKTVSVQKLLVAGAY